MLLLPSARRPSCLLASLLPPGCGRSAAASLRRAAHPPTRCSLATASPSADPAPLAAAAQPPASAAASAEPAPPPPAAGPLSLVDVVLVEPAGPSNVGGAARALQCFGLGSLVLVKPGPFVVDPATGAFSPEALDYAVSAAAGVLAPAGRRLRASPLEAAAGATLVFAATARPRDRSLRVLTPRQAAAEAVAHARRGLAAAAAAGAGAAAAAPAQRQQPPPGRVAFLFGSERAGLSNDDLACAHAVVCVPTASAAPRSGSGGRFSLNLSAAVALVAYELHQAAGEAGEDREEGPGAGGGGGGAQAPAAAAYQPQPQPQQPQQQPQRAAPQPPAVTLLDAGARARLVDELAAALGALTVMPPPPPAPAQAQQQRPAGPQPPAAAATAAGDDDDGADGGGGGGAGPGPRAEVRALTRALASAPLLATRDAAPLFALARRVTALRRLAAAAASGGGGGGAPPPGPMDGPVLAMARAAAADAGLLGGGAPPPPPPPRGAGAVRMWREAALRAVRDAARGAGLSLTKAEGARVVERLAADAWGRRWEGGAAGGAGAAPR